MTALPAPVTLTTDFGTADHYVAQMKGVLLRLAPAVPIVDVTHDIPPQNTRRAAWIVADLAAAFPPGTIHVAVVDPGVGTSRLILAVAADGQFFIAPDNGLLSLIFDRSTAAVVLPADFGDRHAVSSTFHGRDLMMPAAAHLAIGRPLTALGPVLDRQPVMLDGLAPVRFSDRIEASVVRIDRFGNAVTNLRWSLHDDICREACSVAWSQGRVDGIRRCYSDAALGQALALVGSSGYLELALNGGSAAERLGLVEGATITVRMPAT